MRHDVTALNNAQIEVCVCRHRRISPEEFFSFDSTSRKQLIREDFLLTIFTET